MQKGILLLAVLAIVLVAGFAVAHKRVAAPTPQGVATTTARTFAWRFESTESPDGVLPPKTRVALITGGDVYDLGSYAGSCVETKDENLLEGEIAAVLCWWAGHGDEIGVFKDGSGYSVMLGSQEESTVEDQGFRGDFKELVAIP